MFLLGFGLFVLCFIVSVLVSFKFLFLLKCRVWSQVFYEFYFSYIVFLNWLFRYYFLSMDSLCSVWHSCMA